MKVKRKISYFKKSFIVTLLTLIILGLGRPALAARTEVIVLQLRWNHQYQFAGYYAAKWLGYYAREGLAVEIRPAYDEQGNILNAITEVSEGRADFGVGASDILIAQDKGIDLSVVSSVFQRSAVGFYMSEELPFKSLADLVDFKVGRRENDLLDLEFQAMLLKEGINPSRLPLISEGEDFTIYDIVSGKYDIVPGYLGGEIEYFAHKNNIGIKSIKPIDYGVDFYGDSLFTKRSLALNNPELVEKFRRASMKGWEYALENPEEIIDRMSKELFKYDEGTIEDFTEYNRFQADKLKELTLYPVVDIGNINPHRWKQMHETLSELDIVKNKIDINAFIFDYEKLMDERNQNTIETLIKFLGASLLLSIVLFFVNLSIKNNMLKKEIEERKKAENMFRKEFEENKRKEGLLIHKAKQAAMGEMIANIAHQWRQPLNTLGLILANIGDAYEYNELNKEYLNASIQKSKNIINQMSNTIDDFRYFLSPVDEQEEFYVNDRVKYIIDLLEENLRFNDIKVILERVEMVKSYGTKNQYSQAIFSIINNSIDALSSIDKENKEIRISIYSEEDMAVVEIKDNGGGIAKEIEDKIFDVYFTTKSQSGGTGLGLYIVKIIIEDRMKGKVEWANTGDGVYMKISIPKDRRDENE